MFIEVFRSPKWPSRTAAVVAKVDMGVAKAAMVVAVVRVSCGDTELGHVC